MKKTRIIELFANIKRTLIPFISVTLFMALAVGVYSGLEWTGIAFEKSIENAYRKNNIYDLEIIYPYGFSLDDIVRIEKEEGVSEIDSYNFSYECFIKDDIRYQAKVVEISQKINNLTVTKGKLPQSADEVLIEEEFALKNNIMIGDTITFEHDDDGYSSLLSDISNKEIDEIGSDYKNHGMKYLNNDTYKVVGYGESAAQLTVLPASLGVSSDSIPLSTHIYATSESFDIEAFNGKTALLIQNDELKDLNTGSDEYIAKAKSLKERIASVVEEVVKEKNTRIFNDADTLILSGQQKLEDGQKEIEEADKEIDDARKDILEGQEKIVEAKEELSSKSKEIAENDKEIEDYKVLLIKGEEELKSKEEELSKKKQEFKDNREIYEKRNNSFRELTDAYYEEFIPFRELLEETRTRELKDCIDFVNDENNAELMLDYPELARQLSELDDYTANSEDSDHDKVLKAAKMFMEIEDYPMNSVFMKLILVPLSISGDALSIAETYAISFKEFFNEECLDELYRYSKDAGNMETYNNITDILNKEDYGESDAISEVEGLIENYNAFLGAFKTELEKGEATLNEKEKELLDAKRTIEDAHKQLNEGIDRLNEGKKELNDAYKKLAETIEKLNDGQKELEDNIIKLQESKEEFSKSKDRFETIKEKKEDLKYYDASIQSRNANVTYSSAKTVMDIYDSSRNILTSIFAIIGLFILYSAITRLVYNQSVLIGTKKALGFSDFAITTSLLAYSGVSAILGSVLGLMLGRWVLEPLLLTQMRKNFKFKDAIYFSSYKKAMLIVLFVLIVCSLITYLAAKKVLKKNAITLMQNTEIPSQKRHFFENSLLWKKLPLINKTIFNNFLNDKRRAFATIAGIAGCTALMISGFTTMNLVNKSFDRQFVAIVKADTVIYLDSEDEESFKEVEKILNEKQLNYTRTYLTNLGLEKKDGTTAFCQTFVGDEKLEELITIYGSDEKLKHLNAGVFTSVSYYNYYGMDSGEDVTMLDLNKNERTVSIVDGFEFYLPRNTVLMSFKDYQRYFGSDVKANCIILDRNDYSFKDISLLVKDIKGVKLLSDYYEDGVEGFKTVSTIANSIAVVYVVSGLLMSLLVVFNLLEMHILEKKREIITLLVNGFSVGAAKKYIYVDTIFLTIIGLIIGTLAGNALGLMAIDSYITATSYFIRKPDLLSDALTIVINVVLMIILSLIALRKVNKFKLSDINN